MAGAEDGDPAVREQVRRKAIQRETEKGSQVGESQPWDQGEF